MEILFVFTALGTGVAIALSGLALWTACQNVQSTVFVEPKEPENESPKSPSEHLPEP